MSAYKDMKLKGVLWVDGDFVNYWCPGCKTHHMLNIVSDCRPCWQFNGNFEKPTFKPSVRCWFDGNERRAAYMCHVWITDGVIEFLGDCTHELKGKKVPMEAPHI